MKESLRSILKIKTLLTALSVVIILSSCSKNQTQLDELSTDDTSSLAQVEEQNDLYKIATTSASVSTVVTGYDLTKSLPSNYVKDGSVDYTAYLQTAINQNSTVTLPAFPILINEKGLVIPSDRNINFIVGSKLIAKPTSSGNYNVLRMEKVSNIVVNYPIIVGDVDRHLGSTGEWGMGISIISSSNITINGGEITKCWGDGIYLGTTTSGSNTNNNIKITKTILQNNRRSGISIISANGLTLESVVAGNSKGILPMTGINFEPDSPIDELQNINVLNCKTEYNGEFGIQLSYSNLYGGPNKNTNITIQNHYDKRSGRALKASAYIEKRKGSETLSGTLTINNPFWRENPVSPILTGLTEKNLRLLITKPVIADASGKSLSQQEMITLLTYKRNINQIANYSITF